MLSRAHTVCAMLANLPGFVITQGIMPLLPMHNLCMLQCASKVMRKYADKPIQKKMERDARMLPFVEALRARVQAHTGLPIYFSFNRREGAGKAITYRGHLGKRLVANSIITILDGRITLERGLSFRFSSGESEVILVLDMTEVGHVKTLKYEIWSLEGECFKVPDGTAFEELLEMFELNSKFYEWDRKGWEVEKKELPVGWDGFEDDRRERMQEPSVAAIEADVETVNDISSNEVIEIIDTVATGRRDDDCIILGDDDCFIVEDS